MSITAEQFRNWLIGRRDRGESLQAIGADLGTSRQSVQQWIAGTTPSGPALRVAELLMNRQSESWPL